MGRQDCKRMKLCQQFPSHPLQFLCVHDGSNISEDSIFLTDDNPLGLRLRKSPSLLDLIQKQLSSTDQHVSDPAVPKGGRGKLKAANCPALCLQIGIWQYVSCFDGNLVVKCYYAKRKLVWEILHGKLKRKMEIQWSDISALKAVFPEGQPATLELELSRPPLFFDETTPQPRKHTLWRSTTDFTDGQATTHRHHVVQFAEGVFNRHFAQMLNCDARLMFLSRQTSHIIDSCFLELESIDINIENQMLQGERFFTYSPLRSNVLWFEAPTFSDTMDFTVNHDPLLCSSTSRPSLGISQDGQQMKISIAVSHNSVLDLRAKEVGVASSYSEAEGQLPKTEGSLCNFQNRVHLDVCRAGDCGASVRVFEKRAIQEQTEIYPAYRNHNALYTFPREPHKRWV